MSRWFRHYAGMMRDEKLVSAAIRSKQPVERVVWVWGALLESASEVNDAGRYEFDAGEAAYFLRADESDIQDILSALISLGRISEGSVVRWSDRQFESDQSKDRQKRYRERVKASRDGGVTSRDGEVTAQETETETDLDSSLRSEDARAPEFEIFWQEYPNKIGEPAARLAFSKARSRASFEKIIVGTKAYARKLDDRQWMNPVKWLSGDHWGDQPARPPDKPPPKPNGVAHLRKSQSRDEYIAAEKARSERSFR